MKEPEVLEEIHRIRRRHYRQTQGKDHAAVMAAVEKRASAFLEKLNLTLPVCEAMAAGRAKATFSQTGKAK